MGADDRELGEHAGFPVDVPGFQGTLEQLVIRAQRGEIDLTDIPVHEITAAYASQFNAAEIESDPRRVADFLTLATRLVSLKAARLLPDGVPLRAGEEDSAVVDDPGRRLAEYRLYRAAAEALLAEAGEEGARSFYSLVAPDVVAVERLEISAESLAAAFRAVLARIGDVERAPVGEAPFSVAEKAEALRRLLAERGTVAFEEVFEGVASRMEAVACFLALLELLKAGEARVAQRSPLGRITVSAHG